MTLATFVLWLAGGLLSLLVVGWLRGLLFIPHNKVGIVEKLWSGKGSLREGRIFAIADEAGYQADLLRGGAHAFFFPWQYRIHREPLVSTVHDGPRIVSGEVIAPELHAQAGGVDHDCFQDPEPLLALGGRQGKQLQVLTDGTYLINRWLKELERFVEGFAARADAPPAVEDKGQ